MDVLPAGYLGEKILFCVIRRTVRNCSERMFVHNVVKSQIINCLNVYLRYILPRQNIDTQKTVMKALSARGNVT